MICAFCGSAVPRVGVFRTNPANPVRSIRMCQLSRVKWGAHSFRHACSGSSGESMRLMCSVTSQAEMSILKQKEIILYHYSYSPYARKVIWYLALRGIPYKACLQPPIMPRPDLELLNIQYRRIPLVAIGRDVYCDTRLILRKLEEIFPSGSIGPRHADGKAIQRLLEKWTTDAGVFNSAAALIPPDLPLMKDPKFLKDRRDLTGRDWGSEEQAKGRPEALVHIRDAFDLLETTLLADGREWILKSSQPSLADIDAIWPFHWLLSMKGALPPETASPASHPKVFSWIRRFNKALDSVQASAPKPKTINGDEAAELVVKAECAKFVRKVDTTDPLRLALGAEIDVWPIDSGFSRRDRGRLVLLTPDEVVIAVKTGLQDKEIHLHMPRWGFRISEAKQGSRI